MPPDQQNPGTLTLDGSPCYAFSILLDNQNGDTAHTLTIVQSQPTKEAALAEATRLAEGSNPGYKRCDWVCCQLKTATKTPA